MQTSWKIIFGYRLGPQANAQNVYDDLFKAALSYKLGKSGLFAIPVSNKTLTDSIFNLNAHDILKINDKGINGQQLKELFITTIFLKFIESKFIKQTSVFIVLPHRDTSCDTAVMISKPEMKITKVNQRELRLSSDHYPYLLQVKEYTDFKRLTDDSLLTPGVIDVKKLELIARNYSELTLIFFRDFFNFESESVQNFLEKHPNCYFISIPDEIRYIPEGSKDRKYISIKLDKNKHNYIISFPDKRFSIISFNRPKCLVKMNGFKDKR